MDVTSGSVADARERYQCAQCVVFSDGTKVASGCGTTVKLWDVTSRVSADAGGAFLLLASVSFSPDGTKVASGSFDKTVKLWDVMSGECLQTGGAFYICDQSV